MFREFKEFISRGNVLDLAVGVIIGAAFGAIVKSFVDDILMPPIGLLLGGVDFANIFVILKQGTPAGPYATLALAQEAGAVTMNFGLLVNAFVSFVITAFAIFLVVKAMDKVKKKEEAAPPAEPTTKTCPFCATEIPIPATRCPHCTSELGATSAVRGGVSPKRGDATLL
jgi:large conductance mechanosensitive channel